MSGFGRIRSLTQMAGKYDSWSKQELVAHLIKLESSLSSPSPAAASTSNVPQGTTATQEISKRKLRTRNKYENKHRTDASPFEKLPRRKIALKFSYLGTPYCGLAIQDEASSPKPTVEAVLMSALEKSNLIDKGKGWEGCGFSRCGRTDRGVSAAGQVVSLWVRSRIAYDGKVHEHRVDEIAERLEESSLQKEGLENGSKTALSSDELSEEEALAIPSTATLSYSPINNPKTPSKRLEFPYVSIINRFLPPTIRILAWSSLSPDDSFDARHSCISRHYKYFFSLNACPSGDGPGLDLEAMRQAAGYLVGEHDFRNLCKVDGSKQVTHHIRGIHSATISPVDPLLALPFVPSPYSNITPKATSPTPSTTTTSEQPGTFYVLDLMGKAFLYHQVRHIMAVLFLVGSRLEKPTIILDLFKWESKPSYEMADERPLLLWDCGFPEGSVEWQYGSIPLSVPALDRSASEDSVATPLSHLGFDSDKYLLFNYTQLSTSMLESYHQNVIESLMNAHFHAALRKHNPMLVLDAPVGYGRKKMSNGELEGGGLIVKTPLGANEFKVERCSVYPPLETRKRGEIPDVINARWKAKNEKKVQAKKELKDDDE
ncbi:Pseudouridylate synthase [Phaffia rhodozyma]|uniref:Pseudouridylate synthase n=1 Tax=Phaffia rhodozyma TaxID=264483 RepID=A0A0F7SVB8_PHARH|nr:Pseudouridylate synthase [Phaffia rhodozyma]